MNEEIIKEGLNSTGVFLQRNIFNAFRIHGFGARREEPYFRRTKYKETIEGTADIVAAIPIDSRRVLCLIVECKRANQKQKHWVFENRDNTEELPYPFWYLIPTKGLHYSFNTIFPTLGYPSMKDFDQAIQAFEFKDMEGKPNANKIENSLSRDANEKVYTALKQAQEALSCLYSAHTHEELARKRNKEVVAKMDVAEKIYYATRSSDIIYLPIVVTTANLWMMKYNPQDIDRKSGTIPIDKLSLTPKQWVHYEFPLPESYRVEGKSSEGKITPVKSPVFVVNSESFDNFINGLLKDVKEGISK